MKKILLIEDDKAMRESTAAILALAQYEVLTAENGKAGVALAKERSPDLIICDIMMPELNGYDVLHILSKTPETASIPFIFLTAQAEEEESELLKGMEAGADDYLSKPFEEIDLLKVIEIRFKKSEILKKEFAKNLDGLQQFLGEARGLKDLGILSHNCSGIPFKKKEMVFCEGEIPKNLFFLNKGHIKTYKYHEDGNEYVTSLYKEGDFFGYTALFEKAKYAESAAALEDCEICLIPKEDFLSLIYRNRDVAGCFIKMLSGSVAENEKKLMSLSFDSVRRRVAEALLTLEQHYRELGRKQTRFKIIRDDLAGMVGTATETVIRCLSEFKSEELIQIDGREMVILDLAGIQNI